MKTLTCKYLFLTSLLMLLNASSNHSYAQCNLTDWQALQALYVSTNGPTTWVNTTGWDQVDPLMNPSPPIGCNLGTMYGVQLDASGRVQKVNLVNNKLSGTIPSQIGDLTFLTELSLGNNQIGGSIPTTIGNLTNLTSLILNDNLLAGAIPSQIWTLVNMTQLNLGTNQLTGSIPSAIGNLTNLDRLTLKSNDLTGPIPPEMWTLTSMIQLNLNDNNLTGSIPPDIGDLTMLTNLVLGDNLFSGPIPSEIGNLNLTNLFLDNNQFTGGIPISFSSFTNLIQFNISNNLLVGCYDPSLTNLCNFSNGFVSNGNNFDAAWQDFCVLGSGACVPVTSCAAIPHVIARSADVYLDDACYGVILTSPGGMCFRLRVQDDGSFISESVTCP